MDVGQGVGFEAHHVCTFANHTFTRVPRPYIATPFGLGGQIGTTLHRFEDAEQKRNMFYVFGRYLDRWVWVWVLTPSKGEEGLKKGMISALVGSSC